MEGSPNHLNQQTELQELDEHENNQNIDVNERPKKKIVTLWTLYFHLCTKKELFLVRISII